MSILVLQVRPGDLMIVNGAVMRFRTRARIDLPAHARFLLGKQIMSRDQAYSPARRIYFALQAAYVGPDGDREAAQHAARRLISKFQVTASDKVGKLLDQALFAAESDDHYQALKLVRLIIRHEDADLTRTENPSPIVSWKGGRTSADRATGALQAANQTLACARARPAVTAAGSQYMPPPTPARRRLDALASL